MEPQNGVESRDVWTTPGYLDQRHPLLEYLVWYSKTRTLKRTDAVVHLSPNTEQYR